MDKIKWFPTWYPTQNTPNKLIHNKSRILKAKKSTSYKYFKIDFQVAFANSRMQGLSQEFWSLVTKS